MKRVRERERHGQKTQRERQSKTGGKGGRDVEAYHVKLKQTYWL